MTSLCISNSRVPNERLALNLLSEDRHNIPLKGMPHTQDKAQEIGGMPQHSITENESIRGCPSTSPERDTLKNGIPLSLSLSNSSVHAHTHITSFYPNYQLFIPHPLVQKQLHIYYSYRYKLQHASHRAVVHVEKPKFQL